MSWIITLRVTECGSATTRITGARITSGTVYIGTTDANGQIIIPFDDMYEWVILTVSKGSVDPCMDNPSPPPDRIDNPSGHPGYISRNVTVHANQDGQTLNECLNLDEWPDCSSSGGGISCFIVSATTGSSDSAEVVGLRALRDRVSAKSYLGAQLITEFYNEYETFSPGIAADLQLDATAREVVLQLVVRPLIAWFKLAGTLGFGESDERVRQRKHELSDACLLPLADGVLAQLTAVREGAVLPAEAPAMVRELAPRIAQLRFASWGLIDPLIRTWRSVRDGLDVIDEVAQWLSTAPLEELPLRESMDPESLERELAALASFFDFRQDVKGQLGERLSGAWPEATSALQSAGFLPQAEPDS